MSQNKIAPWAFDLQQDFPHLRHCDLLKEMKKQTSTAITQKINNHRRIFHKNLENINFDINPVVIHKIKRNKYPHKTKELIFEKFQRQQRKSHGYKDSQARKYRPSLATRKNSKATQQKILQQSSIHLKSKTSMSHKARENIEIDQRKSANYEKNQKNLQLFKKIKTQPNDLILSSSSGKIKCKTVDKQINIERKIFMLRTGYKKQNFYKKQRKFRDLNIQYGLSRTRFSQKFFKKQLSQKLRNQDEIQ